MDSMQIGLGILIALFTLVGIGSIIWVKKSGQRFIVAGRSLPLVLIGTMLLAQATDANATLGASAEAQLGGFWLGWVLAGGLAMCLFVTAMFYAKPLNRMKLITLPDYYFRRFDMSHQDKHNYNYTELLTGLIMIVSFGILVAGNIAGAGWILSWVFPVTLFEGMLIMAIIVFVYTVTGGIFASATTNVIQLYPAFIAFVGAAIYLFTVHGWGMVAEAVPATYLDLSAIFYIEDGALIFWASLLALGLGDVVALDFMERIFCSDSPETAQKGCLWGGFFTVIIGSCAALIGLFGMALVPEVLEPRNVMPALSTEVLPYVAGLFILAGVVGAGASTASGGLLAVSAVISRNFFTRNVFKWQRQDMDEVEKAKFDQRLLLITRIMTIPVMAGALTFAWLRPEPGILLVLAFDVVFAGCWIPLTLGLFWKKANFAGAVTAVIVGTGLRAILYYTIPLHLEGLDTLIPPVVSLITLVVVSLATQKSYPPNYEANFEIPSDEDVISGAK